MAFSSSNSTNNLRAHLNACTKTDKSNLVNQQTVHDFYSSSKELKIPNKIKLSITEACTELYSLDGRAFAVMKGQGFQNLAKCIFNAGRLTHKSSIRLEDLLSHPTTVRK